MARRLTELLLFVSDSLGVCKGMACQEGSRAFWVRFGSPAASYLMQTDSQRTSAEVTTTFVALPELASRIVIPSQRLKHSHSRYNPYARDLLPVTIRTCSLSTPPCRFTPPQHLPPPPHLAGRSRRNDLFLSSIAPYSPSRTCAQNSQRPSKTARGNSM